MGKKLIIKGADFSRNGISGNANNLYNEAKDAFKVGTGIVSIIGTGLVEQESNNRASVFSIDLSPYAEQGYSHIKVINENNPVNIILAVGTTLNYKVYDKDGQEKEWNWDNDSFHEGDFGANEYLYINCRYANDGEIPLNTAFEYFVKSIVLS